MVVGGTTDSFLWECIKQSLCVIGLDKNRQTRKKETMHWGAMLRQNSKPVDTILDMHRQEYK